MYDISAGGGGSGGSLSPGAGITGVNGSNVPSGTTFGSFFTSPSRSDRDLSISDVLSNLLPSIQDTLLSMSNSSIQAEKAATDAANAFQWKLQKDNQSFNSAEALKAFERNQISADKQMAFQTAERLAQQDFIKDQRSTSYQTAVADLEAAGLNPALAIAGLSGAPVTSASAGSGASATSSAAQGSGGSAKKADISSALGVQQRMATSILSAAVTAAGNELSSSTKYGAGALTGILSVIGSVAGGLIAALV